MLGECAVSKKKTIGIIAGRIMGIVTVATHIYKQANKSTYKANAVIQFLREKRDSVKNM